MNRIHLLITYIFVVFVRKQDFMHTKHTLSLDKKVIDGDFLSQKYKLK